MKFLKVYLDVEYLHMSQDSGQCELVENETGTVIHKNE
jgi:hypothetical protein